MSFSHLAASLAQACGFLNPLCLSQTHFMQIHISNCTCSSSCLCSLILFDILIRSATVFISWFLSMHFAFTVVSGCGTAPGWYHAGRAALTLGERRIAARFVPYAIATLSILLIHLFSRSALGPFVGALHVWRYVFTSATANAPRGADTFINMSVTIAHVCHEGVRLRSLSSTLV